MAFPADTYPEAVELSITASNQLHTILNGDSTTEVAVEDGSKIPSVRKAYSDSLFFLSPQSWDVGEYETVYNQLRAFVEPTGITTWWFSKTATVSTPTLMSTTPHNDSNWTLWNAINNSVYETQKRLAAEAGLNMVGSFLLGATVTTVDDVVFYETDGRYYAWGGTLPKVVSAGSTPATSGGIGAGAWSDRTDVTLRGELSASDGASLSLSQVATSYGIKFSDLSPFSSMHTYNVGDYIFYGNSVWTPYENATTQQTVTHEHFYMIPKRGERYSPEMFGCSGLGESSPDTHSFAKMLGFIPENSTIWLTPGAEYYNEMPDSATDVWEIHKKITIIGFGVKLSRRPSVAGDENPATLRVLATGVKIIGDIDIDGNEPEAIMVYLNAGIETQLSGIGYSRALASSHGIHIAGAADVTIDGPYIHHNNFNIWAYGADNLIVKCRLHMSGQLYPVTTNDWNLGAGIKLTSCENFNIDVIASYCTNAGVEIEPDNSNGHVNVIGLKNFQSDITITNSSDITYFAKGSGGRYGTQISSGVNNVYGTSIHSGNTVAALNVVPLDSEKPIGVIDINLTATDCLGKAINHDASIAAIDNFYYKVKAINCNINDGSVFIVGQGCGSIGGCVKGSAIGLVIGNTTDFMMADLDLTGNTLPYYVAEPTAVYGMSNVKTPLGIINMLQNSVSSVYNVKQGLGVGTYQFAAITDSVTRASNMNNPSLPTAGSFSGQFWYDTADGNTVKYVP